MELPSSHEIIRLEPVSPSRPRISDCLSAGIPRKLNSEKAIVREDLVGQLYSIDGKAYILTRNELVFDSDTEEPVFDPTIYNKVFDRREEDLQIEAAILRRAKHLAHGDSILEESLADHYRFSGLPQESEEPEIKAA